jgi:hypothetical protein
VLWLEFIPAKGTTGGILVGCRSSVFETIAWQGLEFCVVAIVKNKVDNLVWRLIVVYGSPYEETKGEFINELHLVLDGWHGPTLMRVISIWSGINKRKVMGW